MTGALLQPRELQRLHDGLEQPLVRVRVRVRVRARARVGVGVRVGVRVRDSRATSMWVWPWLNVKRESMCAPASALKGRSKGCSSWVVSAKESTDIWPTW